MTPEGWEPGRAEYIAARAGAIRRMIPPRYHADVPAHPGVARWCDEVIAAYSRGTPMPPSLFLLGPTGTGKTTLGYAALQRVVLGALRTDPAVLVTWKAANCPDWFALLRPGATADPEGEFAGWADTMILLLDDLGAHKGSEWTEEQLYRLVDRRYSWERPSVYVTNLPPASSDPEAPTMETRLSSRIRSRLAACRQIILDGPDNRLGHD